MLVLLKYKTYSTNAVVEMNDAGSWTRDGMSLFILSTRGNFVTFRAEYYVYLLLLAAGRFSPG